jgi:hypothetical protein
VTDASSNSTVGGQDSREADLQKATRSYPSGPLPKTTAKRGKWPLDRIGRLVTGRRSTASLMGAGQSGRG